VHAVSAGSGFMVGEAGRATRYAYLWEFLVEPGQRGEFEQQYGPRGAWVSLFRQAPGYLGTWLLRDAADPRRFITVDRWHSAAAYQSFRSAFARQYAELDARCAGLTVTETCLGSFDEPL
jgi:heme-degrading monooxygenase HmoA